MSKYVENFVEVLREHLPLEDHPDKQYYTCDQVIREYEPHMLPVDEFDYYGEGQCICGHNIKYIYKVAYKRDIQSILDKRQQESTDFMSKLARLTI